MMRRKPGSGLVKCGTSTEDLPSPTAVRMCGVMRKDAQDKLSEKKPEDSMASGIDPFYEAGQYS